MAKDKSAFKMYADQRIFFDQLPDELAGKVIKHLFAYVNDENPLEDDLLLKLAFAPLKRQLKHDLKKYEEIVERNKLNGQKGGRPKKPTGLSGLKNKPKKADKDKDKDIEDINIPNFDDFRNYALSKKGNLNFSHDALRLKYESWKVNNWKDGYNKPIKNWKTKLLNSLPYLKERKQINQI